MIFPSSPALHSHWSTLVCLLGSFHVFCQGRVMAIRSGGKTEAVLCCLALRYPRPVPRATVLATVWPDTDPELAGQALRSVICSLRKQFDYVHSVSTPLVYTDGGYRLNSEAGVGVDVACFDGLALQGEQQAREGDQVAAIASFMQALEIYGGDLVGPGDVYTLMERERLRAHYLTLLSRIADHVYETGDCEACLRYVQRLLADDPCREDAHRLAMRCYVRLGQRSQALRQYNLCQEMLRREFDAGPEASTTSLYNQIRLDPTSI